MTMKERLARAIIGPHKEPPSDRGFSLAQLRQVRWVQATDAERQSALNEAEAVLREMLVPSDGMLSAQLSPIRQPLEHYRDYQARQWQAAIQAAIDE